GVGPELGFMGIAGREGADDRPRLVRKIDLAANIEADVLAPGALTNDELAHAWIEFAPGHDPDLWPQLPGIRADPAHLRIGIGTVLPGHHVHDLRQLRRRERAAIAAARDASEPGDQRHLVTRDDGVRLGLGAAAQDD